MILESVSNLQSLINIEYKKICKWKTCLTMVLSLGNETLSNKLQKMTCWEIILFLQRLKILF